MSSKDTFKRTAPTIQFFKDGETIRAKKLGKMIEKIQDGMFLLETVVGDIHNRSIFFESNPLFQNSIARSMGPMNQITVVPNRQFALIQKTKQSLHQGLVRWPFAVDAAGMAGNLSMNLLPVINQEDKAGIGCTRDDGSQCTGGFQSFYNREKNLLVNGLFEQSLSGWDTQNATSRALGGVTMDVAYQYNVLEQSEHFETWTLNGPAATVSRDAMPDPNGQSATYKIVPQTSDDAYLDLQQIGSTSEASQDWCFSVWLAASGEREVFLSVYGPSGPTVDGSQEGGVFLFPDDGNQYLGLHISGSEWKRYYVHVNGGSISGSAITAKIILNLSGQIDTTPLFAFGAQIEPRTTPTEYRRTEGAATSGLGGEVVVSQDLAVVPGHVYQITLEGTGSLQARAEGVALATMAGSQLTAIFTPREPIVTIDAYVSGVAPSTNYLTLFRVDPGAPCHAMSCPGFSAYNKIHAYRAVLPPITVSGHQYFARRLELPDEFHQALFDELPGNILGVFDHELNHAVPDQIVDWRLTNWKIGGFALNGLVSDPEFFSDWQTISADELPGEFAPVAEGNGGLLIRDEDPTSIISTTVSSYDPVPHLKLPGHVTDGELIRSIDNVSFKNGTTGITMDMIFSLDTTMGPNHWALTQSTMGITHVYQGKLAHLSHYSAYYGMTNTGNYTQDYRDGLWHHLAVVQKVVVGAPNSYYSYLYIDGILVTTNHGTGSFYAYNATPLPATQVNIGWDGVLGNISGVRVAGFMLRDYAAYSGNFTPPAGALLPSGTAAGTLSGIMLYWPMDEGAGVRLHDVSVSGFHASRGNDPAIANSLAPAWITTGLRTWTEKVDSTHSLALEYYTIEPSGNLDYAWNMSMTIEGWAKIGDGITSGISGYEIFNRYATPSNFDYINYEIGIEQGKYVAKIQSRNLSGTFLSTETTDESNPTISDDGQWHHFAATFKKDSAGGNPIKLYVDGVLKASATGSTTNWDWRIPQGTTDIFETAAPSGMRVGINAQGHMDFAISEIVVTSGIRYTANFTPTYPIQTSGGSGYTEDVLAHIKANEAQGITLYDTGLHQEKPLVLYGIGYQGATTQDATPDWRWRTDNQYTSVSTVGVDADRLIIQASGNSIKGVEKTFALSQGQIFTWNYKIKANLNYSGIMEIYTVPSGTAELDLLMTSEFVEISSPLDNLYKLSPTEPGDTTWSQSLNGGFYNIRRRIKATGPGTIVNLFVGVSGNSSLQQAVLDSFDLSPQVSNSTLFQYIDAPVLGLNWEGTVEHVIEENLLPWSENLNLTNSPYLVVGYEFGLQGPHGLLNATKVFTNDGAWGYEIPFGDLLDSTFTVQFWARSNNLDNSSQDAQVEFDTPVAALVPFTVTNEWQQFAFTVSNIDLFNTTPVFNVGIIGIWIYPPEPSNEIELAEIVYHHGSGIVPYEKTYGQPIKRYRHAVRVNNVEQINSNWMQLYGLIGGLPIQSYLTTASYSGIIFELDATQTDFVNLPDSGVIRILGQEFAYRGKDISGTLSAGIPNWRGTPMDDSLLVSGKTVTYVPLPQAIDRLEDDLLWFREILPAADGDWISPIGMQLYNTQISNLDRFSLTASAVPLTRAVGGLMTSFMTHVADDTRHFRRDQLCAGLVDSSIEAGFDDMEVRVTAVKRSVEEIEEPEIIEIFAFGFMNPNNKQVVISWGDGSFDTILGTGQVFEAISHTYDLGPETSVQQHTITVEITDLDLQVTRTGSTIIFVTPVSKASQRVRAVVITQPTGTQQSRAAIWAPISGVQQARTSVLISG